MDIDTKKIDETVLALLRLTLYDGTRAWKGFDWDTMKRLHQTGFISDRSSLTSPRAPVRSVSA